MNFDNLSKSLEDLIDSNIESISIPYVKGNSIRIKNYIVRKNQSGYLVYDCKTNERVSELSFKLSALAVAKTLSEGKDFVRKIEQLDQSFLKHYNDVLFYKNKIKKTDDEFVKETRKMRMQVSLEKAQASKQSLEDFIF